MNKEENKDKIKDIIEWIYCFLIAVILALLVRYYIGTPTIVKQSSMYPNFKENERLILNRLYRTCKNVPQRGDIITFEQPSYMSNGRADLEHPTAIYNDYSNGILYNFIHNVVEYGKTSYIKRVIGLPGEHIQIKDGKVFINGEELKEEYLADDVITNVEEGKYSDIIVPQNTVFVMGDNREQSGDSRIFGCIPYERIEGKVVLRFWPLNVFGTVK